MEHRLDDDHRLGGATYPVCQFVDGEIRIVEAPALTAINMRLRDDYTRDAAGGIGRWNKIIESERGQIRAEAAARGLQPQDRRVRGQADRSRGQARQRRGMGRRTSRTGCPARPTATIIQSLMKPCFEPGKFAGWIAPPKVGIDNKPGDFEYVKLHMA